jgi:diguanylate cyclase (GGDEF)-like protein/PAS domain S-box-containing protein
MTGVYDLQLVALSLIVAILASYTALELAGRVSQKQGKSSWIWLAGGAVSMGTGIWSMHFIGMLAFHLPVAVAYDAAATMLSMAIAVVVSGLALFVVSRPTLSGRNITAGAVLMGLGISAMHYTGMHAMRMSPPIEYHPPLFIASVVIAIVASFAALWIAFQLRHRGFGVAFLAKLGSATVMGLAITGMHYTGMAAAQFAPDSICLAVDLTHMKSATLALTIAITTIGILAITLGISAFDTYFDAHTELERRVRERTQELTQVNDELRSAMVLRREAERHLRIYAEVIRSTGESIIITDPDGKVIEVNPAYQRATGRSRDDVIGKSWHVPGRDLHPEEFYDELWSELKAEGHWTGEIMARRNDGESFPSWALFNAVRDEHGKPLHYVCVMRDITKLKQNEQQLEKLAFHDSLTGLPNRALFRDRLNVALAGAARQKSELGVLFLDLDRFKYVNDTLGHAAGDRMLIEISRRIGGCLRSADTLARMGGDEFTILLPHLGAKADAVQVADRIIEAVGKAVQLDDAAVYVGVSIGISYFPNDGRDAETMQKNADSAMFEAKEAGRGQYRVFSAEMLEKGKQRLSLSVQIDAALKNNEFTLAYQPMVNLATGRPEGVEALIRWQKPGGEWVAPATFIPHAEQAGLIKKIDCWVLERACRDAGTWSQYDGRDLAVCVNLSPVSMQQPDMARLIKDILQRTGLPASRLNLEITENAVKADPNAAQAMLEEITSLGVSFSVNDFGSGYSSLSYLSQFPIKCLKLDRQFVERIGKDKASEEVIRTLLQLAQKLDLRVVAEGVEQHSQQIFLANAGCEIMQGYHFVRPMPGDQLTRWLAADHNSKAVTAGKFAELIEAQPMLAAKAAVTPPV